MDVSRDTTEAIKIWLALGGVVLVWLSPRLSAKAITRVLLALTVFATLNYARFGPKTVFEQVDSYDLMHYYLATRYFDELGYYDLYPAALVVDNEHGRYDRKLRRCRIQDDRGYRVVSVRECIDRGEQVRAEQFTPERWRQFEHDFLYLQRDMKMSRGLWREMIQDRGYNATPAWITLMQPVVGAVPVEAIKWLCWLDVIYLGLGLWAIHWAYGQATMLWAWLFLMITYSLRWPMPTLVLARYDWVAALMVAMACLRKAKPVWAGALTGFSALVRLFPAVWMFGPAMQGLMNLVRPLPGTPRLDRMRLRLAAGFLAAVVVIEGAALVRFGPDTARTHAENIAEHVRPEQLSSRRIGFALAYSYRGELTPKYLPKFRKHEIAEQAPERLPIVLVVLAALAYGLRRRRIDEAFAIGFMPFFLLATASYYYYVTRITLIVWHAGALEHKHHRAGLAALLALEVFANWAETVHSGHRVYLIGRLAWGLTAYVVAMAGWLAWEEWRARDTPPPDQQR